MSFDQGVAQMHADKTPALRIEGATTRAQRDRARRFMRDVVAANPNFKPGTVFTLRPDGDGDARMWMDGTEPRADVYIGRDGHITLVCRTTGSRFSEAPGARFNAGMVRRALSMGLSRL